jgi:probable HAF family extracellular repeat protein
MSSRLARLCLVLIGSTALCPMAAMAAPPVGNLVIDQYIPGTLFGARVVGISGDGSKAVGHSYTFTDAVATSWSVTGAASDLGIGDHTLANAISYDGSTIVGSDRSALYSKAFAIRNGAQTILASPLVNSYADAYGANLDGSVIVGSDASAFGNSQAVMWSGPGWSNYQALASLSSGRAAAFGVDGAGHTIVGMSIAADTFGHAVYWQNGAVHDLGLANLSSGAAAISTDGRTIVGYQSDAVASHAVKYSGANFADVTDLGTLGGYSYASAVNANGTVIVGQSLISGLVGYHAFRYADGTMADLNTLMTNVGVDMTGIELTEATGVSGDGSYITVNSTSPGYKPYLVYYFDGAGGLTSGDEQQASVDALGRQRQALAIQHDAYAGILTGDLDRKDAGSDVGVFGLAGSVVGGVRAKAGLGHGLSFSGGLIDGTSSFGGAGIGNGLMGAAALRYDTDGQIGGFVPYGQIGGSFGVLSNVTFTRDYGGGVGVGQTNERLASVYGRVGVTNDLDNGDQASLDAEIGSRWLMTDAYAEAASATNLFPATIGAGTDQMTIGKLGASYSHALGDTIDVTLHAGIGAALGRSNGLAVATGLGTMGTGADRPVWAEAGAHVEWAVTESSAIDLYALGMAGQGIGTNAHVGAGYTFRF